MKDVSKIKNIFEKHMLDFHLNHGPHTYEDVHDYCKKTGYPLKTIENIRKALIHDNLALSYGKQHPGCLKLTPLGRSKLESQHGSPETTVVNISESTISQSNVAVGDSSIHISDAGNLLDEIMRQIQDSKEIPGNEKQSILKNIREWILKPGVTKAVEKAVEVFLS